jgi:hypothetical protein
MKNINWKNIIKGVSVGAALLTLFVVGQNIVLAQSSFNQNASRNNRFLSQSGNAKSRLSGLLNVPGFVLAPNSKSREFSFLNLPIGSSLLLRQYGTALFDNVAAYGNVGVHLLNAGFGTIQSERTELDAAKLKVDGEIKIETLADGNPNDARLRLLCTNDLGILEVCGSFIDTTPGM